ncbi:hypothetical protein [Thermoflavimicrobium daqui]|uniref:SPOR domain-containing protein n=1 Tax=Thermoflavimicrobium daqui TaxID=2137476 RepID=A0A364K8V7_9BACL|nr:hypothetical protein [Thermoflavimicrobium daqui]RAL26652.1 hypothetical protein DL897_00970 [Thermoflavimicrobium daqui]
MDKNKVNVYPQKKGLKIIVSAQNHKTIPPVKINHHPRRDPQILDWLQQGIEFLQKGGKGKKIGWKPSKHPLIKKKSIKVSPNFLQHMLSVGGAILVGVIMGGSLLQLFFSEQPTHLSSIDSHLVKQSPATFDSLHPSLNHLGVIPTLKVVMLQAGNFQDHDGAKKKVQAFRTKGLSAVLSSTEPYRIFLGVGMTYDDALKLSTMFKQKEVDMYLKEWEIGGQKLAKKVKGKKLPVELPKALERGNSLIKQLGIASVQQMKTDSKPMTPFIFHNTWIKDYKKWVTEMQAIEAEFSSTTSDALSEMMRGLSQAMQSGMELQKNPSQALLWQMQEGLVHYITGYDQLTRYLQN